MNTCEGGSSLAAVRVAHVRREAGIYVGRPARGLKGSPLGNPYVIGRDGDRNAVIAQYGVWLADKLGAKNVEVTAAIDELVDQYRSAGALTLTCWCAPEACHGDVVARVVEERAARVLRDRG